jgi:hypothetical protein
MKYTLVAAVFLTLGLADSAHAANLAVITTPPGLMSVAVFLVAVACIILCTQVLSVIRGGLLGRGWRVFTLSFVLLALSQVAMLLNSMEILSIPEYVVPALLVAMSGAFLYGVLETKRTLS